MVASTVGYVATWITGALVSTAAIFLVAVPRTARFPELKALLRRLPGRRTAEW